MLAKHFGTVLFQLWPTQTCPQYNFFFHSIVTPKRVVEIEKKKHPKGVGFKPRSDYQSMTKFRNLLCCSAPV